VESLLREKFKVRVISSCLPVFRSLGLSMVGSYTYRVYVRVRRHNRPSSTPPRMMSGKKYLAGKSDRSHIMTSRTETCLLCVSIL
jgi:hypothetical protein